MVSLTSMTTEPSQLTLDLELPVSDHYTIELRSDEGLNTLRKHEASTPEDALAFVEALRDDAVSRYMVTWEEELPGRNGRLHGLAPGGKHYEVSVAPPLTPVQSSP